TTLIIGILALLLATSMTNVLDLMLYSYAFMVSGLFVPIIGALYWQRSSGTGAIAAMILGGGTTVALEVLVEQLPLGLDANVFGITVSAAVFFIVSLAFPDDTAGEGGNGQPVRTTAAEEESQKPVNI
ncbi:MAG: hypothetical protein R3224_01210, partial [Balneolaceae bacterium]|nr:hypothetical protein [Balneolaceae bacterium]